MTTRPGSIPSARSVGFRSSTDPLVDRDEFEAAVARLEAAGCKVRSGDATWTRFSQLRANMRRR